MVQIKPRQQGFLFYRIFTTFEFEISLSAMKQFVGQLCHLDSLVEEYDSQQGCHKSFMLPSKLYK